MTSENWDATIYASTKNVQREDAKATSGCLVRIHPWELENKLVHITQEVMTLGRDPSSDLFCDDTSISRQHARIRKTPEGFIIEDCQSTNGTFVNGQSISQMPLTEGCQIQVGNHIFKFLAGDSIESQYHERSTR